MLYALNTWSENFECIIACVVAAADDAFRSKLAGELVGNDTYPDTFAEGMIIGADICVSDLLYSMWDP